MTAESRSRYTELVIYAVRGHDADPRGAPFKIAPRELHAALRPDVAPYGTVDAMYAISDVALAFLDAPGIAPHTRSALQRLLDWTDEVEEPWALYQLEPPSIAGLGTANIEEEAK